MLQQPHSLLLDQMAYHVAEHRADSVEPFVRVTNVFQTPVVEQDLLHNEDGHGFAELAPGFHHSQAEGDDLGREQEVNDVGGVVFDQSTNDAE